MLEVYTHSTARPAGPVVDEEYGNTERLAELGKRMLDLVVTYHFFSVKPHLDANEITGRKDDALSDENIVRWIEGYEMKNKIRAYPHTVLEDPIELRTFFHTYIGALYIRNGMAEVQEWISRLIDPTQEPASIHSPPPQQTQGPAPQPPQSPPPPIPPSSMPFNPASPPPMAQTPQGISSLITLQLVNQTAAQKGVTVTYSAESQGPPHAPTWTVQCYVNGQLTGMGQARSQKLAREEAARQTWNTMEWGPQA
ncbi:uncharacterized protein EV420DRAFT_1637681 [Desarmillaria tabescens]|uniref:Uncharacterized protein n=1 Tax=Armillaria tabescens TaxID=1929756 RepID=A0AA39NH75_ARMTA|nr:uncharacterized protein EV420DRAFT_1637681 [Desarmillaria tabescens]KAK0465560.1 hypothetical protein EV420DRAFT_1637681 [Desarmillaria tabescens]